MTHFRTKFGQNEDTIIVQVGPSYQIVYLSEREQGYNR